MASPNSIAQMGNSCPLPRNKLLDVRFAAELKPVSESVHSAALCTFAIALDETWLSVINFLTYCPGQKE